MMYFSDKTLNELYEAYNDVRSKYMRLLGRYVGHRYRNERAREYAQHGFARRLNTLVRCIENIFQVLPPEKTEIPQKHDTLDAVINIQAFVFNVFGAIDNLAWIWVSEKGLLRENGLPIPKGGVGLRRKNKLVRHSFSRDFQSYLDELDEWLDQMEDLRHALAHRIPLYIPPYTVPIKYQEAYESLGRQMGEAAQRADIKEYKRLAQEQQRLGVFAPLIMHSFHEEAKPVIFHGQILADFLTVEELANKLMDELNR